MGQVAVFGYVGMVNGWKLHCWLAGVLVQWFGLGQKRGVGMKRGNEELNLFNQFYFIPSSMLSLLVVL